MNTYVESVVRLIKVTDMPYQDLLNTKEFRAVIIAVVRHHDQDRAIEETKRLMLFLGRVRNVQASDVLRYDRLDWVGRIKEAVSLINQAADKLSDPVYPRLNNSLIATLEHNEAPVCEWIRYGLSNFVLRKLASMIEAEAHLNNKDYALYRGGSVVPVSARSPLPRDLGLKPKNVGKRGGGKNYGRSRSIGMLIRELNERLPKYISQDRFAVIAGLMKLVGYPSVTRQVVRGTLLKGRT